MAESRINRRWFGLVAGSLGLLAATGCNLRQTPGVTADNPGIWAFHCHILPHAESETGMFGMVTALIVEK